LAASFLIRVIVELKQGFGIHDIIMGLVPLIFIYAPVWLCNRRGVDSYSYRLFIPAFLDFTEWRKAFTLAFWMNIGTWSWFVPLYHFYYTELNAIIFGGKGFDLIGTMPKEMALTILFQVFYVALPEEFFYRGYFQTRFNEAYPRKWKVFGAQIGMGAVYTNLLFAFGHSLVAFQWWHFATFFPGMVFSWARERSNGILAAALFHAACNVGIIILDTMYGIRSI
jgi:membrane protease YdiL (CAAX protease family)